MTGDYKRKVKPGYVYLLLAKNGLVKIGRSVNPRSRIDGIISTAPTHVGLYHLIQTHDMFGLERHLHLRFEESRHHGEWFRISDPDLEDLCYEFGNGESAVMP